MEEKLKKMLEKYKINANFQIINKFLLFYEELLEWNNKFNLTKIVNEDEVIVKHFIDSAYPNPFLAANSNILDIGAGAGFPSIPLKIIRDDLSITMLDSLNKRITFLKHIIKTLSLTEMRAIHSRIEDFNERNKFDVVVARAVASLPTLIEYSLPFLKINGILLAYKSNNAEFEIQNSKNSLKMVGGKIQKVYNYNIEENNRCIVVVKKVKPTNSLFPRKKNLPKLKPL